MESVIKVEHLSHRYTVQWAVRDISFDISSRGIYGLLGSNGAGKSTLMNIVCGVINPTEGEIYIKGTNARVDPVAAKKMIGFLPQKPPLYGDLTVEEYLHHAADLRWIPSREVAKAVNEVLEICAIAHFRKRLIKNLSGGYQQRVGIAQAIIHRPELVIFDEPTNGLDPNQIMEIRGLIEGIAKERTVLLSTHILTEVQAICDHILMVEQGKLVFSGSMDRFNNYLAPSSLFVHFSDAPAPAELEKIAGVDAVDELGGGRFRIHFLEDETVSDRIIEQGACNQWHLQEIYPEKVSPDMIFSALSKKVN